MLTNEVEGHKLKCHPYWGRQRDEPVQYGNMEVTLIDESDSSAWKIRCFNLHNKKVFSSVKRQKGESQNGCFKKAKHAKISEK